MNWRNSFCAASIWLGPSRFTGRHSVNIKELEAKRDILLRELASYVPLWDDDQTVLLRMVAARLMRQSGVTREFALSSGANLNSLIKQAITLGYALRVYDERNSIERGQSENFGFFQAASVVEAA